MLDVVFLHGFLHLSLHGLMCFCFILLCRFVPLSLMSFCVILLCRFVPLSLV